MVRVISFGWPGLIEKCRSIFIVYSYCSLTGRFGIMESTPVLDLRGSMHACTLACAYAHMHVCMYDKEIKL